MRMRVVALMAVLAPLLPSSVHSAEEKAQIFHWAPGILRPSEGTVEMDVEFLSPRASMADTWSFLFRLPGNSPGAGLTSLGMVFCPPQDPRDFAALVRGRGGSATVSVKAPDYEIKKDTRVAMTWGKGQFSLWFDGKLLGREPFSGELALLPEKFLAGFDTYSGVSGNYRIKHLRISDTVVSGQALSAPAPLVRDADTTLLIGENGAPEPGTATEWQQNDFVSAIFPVREGTTLKTEVGKPYIQPLCLVNFSKTAQEFTVSAKIRNRLGEQVGEKKTTLTVPPNTLFQPGEISLPQNPKSGFLQAELHIQNRSGRSETFHVAYVNQLTDSLKPGKFADYLGHHKTLYADLGYRWIRAWEGERVFLWSVVEPSKGDFQWEAADRFVKEATKNRTNILGILGYPPAWASTYSVEERTHLGIKPEGTYSNNPNRYQPKNIEEWKDYVRAVVSRYHDTVKYWEIYNEVDFHPPGMQASFSGSTQDYLDLLRAAHQIIKEIDPDSKVLTSGFSLQPITDLNMVPDLMSKGAADAFDILNVHGYTSKETLEKTLATVRAAKPSVPAWQSERAMMGGPKDDYLNVQRAFWMLDKGFSKYFFHGGDFDRDFGEVCPNANFAVSAELARQLRPCDEYLGRVAGVPEDVGSWAFRRTDGSFLQIFAVDNGSVEAAFEPNDGAEMAITNLWGETTFQGVPAAGQAIPLSGLSYVTSASEPKIAAWNRALTNVVNNPDFEIREGDFIMDESLARPSFWKLQPPGTPAKAMSFVPGKSGKYALRLTTPPGTERLHVSQDVLLTDTGKWTLSADIKAPPGTRAFIELKTVQDGESLSTAYQKIPPTGTWQRISLPLNIRTPNAKGTLLIGLLAEKGELEIDNVELIKATKQALP